MILLVSLSVAELSAKVSSLELQVWSISNEAIYCVHVHDMKDQVHSIAVTNTLACFIPQSNGIKVLNETNGLLRSKKNHELATNGLHAIRYQVHSWNGGSKLLNSSKYVKCFTLVNGKLYCGCHDSGIQVKNFSVILV